LLANVPKDGGLFGSEGVKCFVFGVKTLILDLRLLFSVGWKEKGGGVFFAFSSPCLAAVRLCSLFPALLYEPLCAEGG
jgi:hypothetical protein